MKIGIPKEIKNNENRVGMTPAGVAELIRHGHQVVVQHTAGENSGFSDDQYEKVGAAILPDIEAVYQEAEMIKKVLLVRDLLKVLSHLSQRKNLILIRRVKEYVKSVRSKNYICNNKKNNLSCRRNGSSIFL